MKKAVVTGANGFVGSAVCKALCRKNIEVIAVVRNPGISADDISVNGNIRMVYSDSSDFAHLSDMIPDRDVDAFYHFAWEGSAGNLRSDDNVQLRNVMSSCDAARACAALGCSRFVFASSIMEYEILALMEKEITPGANTLYSSAKLAADLMSRTVAGNLGVGYIRAVVSNIYGPGENSPRLINTSLRKMLSGEYCRFSAGEQIYDFIYIDDAAEAFRSLGEKGKANKTYYIGSENPRPLREYILEMRDCVDPGIEIGLGELEYKGISLTYDEFDRNAVREDTGFVPEIEFRKGINKTIRWLKGEYNEF